MNRGVRERLADADGDRVDDAPRGPGAFGRCTDEMARVARRRGDGQERPAVRAHETTTPFRRVDEWHRVTVAASVEHALDGPPTERDATRPAIPNGCVVGPHQHMQAGGVDAHHSSRGSTISTSSAREAVTVSVSAARGRACPSRR